MEKKRKTFTDEFKQDAVQFLTNHPEMTVIECAETLGVGRSTLERWKADFNRSGLSAVAAHNNNLWQLIIITRKKKTFSRKMPGFNENSGTHRRL